jgi:hypothetical protein
MVPDGLPAVQGKVIRASTELTGALRRLVETVIVRRPRRQARSRSDRLSRRVDRVPDVLEGSRSVGCDGSGGGI